MRLCAALSSTINTVLIARKTGGGLLALSFGYG